MNRAWPLVRLGDHLEFITSGSRGWSQYVRESGTMFLRIQNVGRNHLQLDDVAFVDPPLGAEAQRTRVREGDVLLSITADLGRTAVVPADLGPAHINQHLAILRVRNFDPRFVSAYISLGPGQYQLAKLDRVGVKSGLNFDDIRSLQLPQPPLPEQRRIADILDKADAVRRKRKEAIALTEKLLRSAFLEMFGDPVTNPKGWETRELGVIAELYAGNSLPPGVLFDGQRDGVLLLKVGDMNLPGNEVEIATAREWAADAPGGVVAPAGAVVIPKRGGAIATNKKRVLLRPAALDPNLMAIAPTGELSLQYLRQWFDLLDLASLSNGSTVPQLNKKDLAPLLLPVPPMNAQKQFGAFAERLGKLRQRNDVGLKLAENMFDVLTNLAFRGELTRSSASKKAQLEMFPDGGAE